MHSSVGRRSVKCEWAHSQLVAAAKAMSLPLERAISLQLLSIVLPVASARYDSALAALSICREIGAWRQVEAGQRILVALRREEEAAAALASVSGHRRVGRDWWDSNPSHSLPSLGKLH